MNFNLNFRGRGEILLFQYILALPKSWKLKYWRNIQHVERTAFHLFRGFNFARTPKKHVICAVFTKELSPRSQVSTEIRLSQKKLCDNLIEHMFQFSRKMWRGPQKSMSYAPFSRKNGHPVIKFQPKFDCHRNSYAII